MSRLGQVILCADLVKAFPDEHKKFLADLVWVHEEYLRCIDSLQLCSYSIEPPKVEALTGRKNLCDIPEELSETPTAVISGRQRKLHINELRLIIDQGGGLEYNPVAAVVLPSRKIVRES